MGSGAHAEPGEPAGPATSCVDRRAVEDISGDDAIDVHARLKALGAVVCRDGRGILARAMAERALTPQGIRLHPLLLPKDNARVDALAEDPRFLARHGIVSQAVSRAEGRVEAQAADEDTCVLAYYARDWATAVPTCAALAATGNAHAEAALAGVWLHDARPNTVQALPHAERAARAGIRAAQRLVGALLVDATPPDQPVPQAATDWLARAAAQGLDDVLSHIPEGVTVSGIPPLASPIDDNLEAALLARTAGRTPAEDTLLPLHRAWLDLLWADPLVQARLRADVMGRPGEG